ncbi:MAG TPA: hypothetical protein VI488_10800 [Candidatus Angelobacter sp.]
MKAIRQIIVVAVVLGLMTIPASMATTTAAVDDQPHMQQALDALRLAKRNLEQAIPDKGGHRSAAIKACDEAIKHTEEGIKYTSEHP